MDKFTRILSTHTKRWRGRWRGLFTTRDLRHMFKQSSRFCVWRFNDIRQRFNIVVIFSRVFRNTSQIPQIRVLKKINFIKTSGINKINNLKCKFKKIFVQFRLSSRINFKIQSCALIVNIQFVIFIHKHLSNFSEQYLV